MKKNQIEEFSPIEGTLALLLSEVEIWDDSTYLAEGNENQVTYVPYDEFAYSHEPNLYWRAESKLVNNDVLAVFHIAKHKGKYLELFCQEKFSTEMQTVLEDHREILAIQFRKNISSFKAYNRLIKKLASPILSSNTYEAVKSFISDVTGATMAKFVSELPRNLS